jgi:PadR family transcriptional regulator, regulatory protein PadR
LTRPKADLLQGTLDLLILKVHSLGPLHGYGIIQRFLQLSDELLEVEQGSLYSAVYRIEQRGWINSKWGVTESGRRAKFYTLTKAGNKQLKAEEESWDRLALAIAKVRKAV